MKEAVGAALFALGDGNWKMGEGKQVGKTQKASTIELTEKVVLQHYTCLSFFLSFQVHSFLILSKVDIVNTTVSSLTTLSRTQRRGAFGSIFLLNNISYFYSRLVLKPTHPGLTELVTKPTADTLTSAFRTAKAGYFDANFSPLMQALSEDREKEKVGSSAWKAATKEKFTRFYDLLEEVGERHRMAKVLEEEEDGKRAIAEEAVKLVVPSLQRFIQKQRDKEFSKSEACVSSIVT